jgi:putative ABC transport system substrate-binding protein
MNMRRRIVGAMSALSLAPREALAQPARIPMVGILHPGSPPPVSASLFVEPFEQSLVASGYAVGRTIALEYRYAAGKPDRLPAMALELAALGPDVLLAVGTPSVAAARALPAPIPIVAIDFQVDPVASGLIASYARPGGNVTGLFLDLPQATAKWLQLVVESARDARRVAVLWDVTTGTYQLDAMTRAARERGVRLDILELKAAADFEVAQAAMLKDRPDALVQFTSPTISLLTAPVARFTLAQRIPAISPYPSFPAAGGLMSYGPDLRHLYQRLGPLIDRILKGARPAAIPAERPSKFELVINLATARALQLTIPASVRLSADRIIE